MPTHALLIGIDDYTSPDAPTLRGSRNDAVRFWRQCVDQLLVPPANIRLLCHPPISEEMLTGGLSGPCRVGVTWSEAAHATVQGSARASDIQAALHDLGDQLRADPRAAALVTYSGHGTIVEPPAGSPDSAADLALCAQDYTTDQPPAGLVPFGVFRDAFIEGHVEHRITVVVDTCYTAAGADDEVVPTPASTDDDPMYYRFLMAAAHGEVARSITVDARQQGAFSWAISTVIAQWQLDERGGFDVLTMSHAELVVRARLLLEAIGVQQTPWIAGVRSLDVVGVFDPNDDWSDLTQAPSRNPDVSRPGRQLWAGDTVCLKYGLRKANGKTILTVGGTAPTEQWDLKNDKMVSLLSGHTTSMYLDLESEDVSGSQQFSWDRTNQTWSSVGSVKGRANWRTFVSSDGSVCLEFQYTLVSSVYTLQTVRWITSNDILAGDTFDPLTNAGSNQQLPLTLLPTGQSVTLPAGSRWVQQSVPAGITFTPSS